MKPLTNAGFNVLDKEIIYLTEHCLLSCQIQNTDGINRTIALSQPIFITAKGIDYLQSNGGLTRMMHFHFALQR